MQMKLQNSPKGFSLSHKKSANKMVQSRGISPNPSEGPKPLSLSSSGCGKKAGSLNLRACSQLTSSSGLQDRIGKIKAYSTPLPKSIRPFNHQAEIQFSQGNPIQLVVQDKISLHDNWHVAQHGQGRVSFSAKKLPLQRLLKEPLVLSNIETSKPSTFKHSAKLQPKLSKSSKGFDITQLFKEGIL